MFVIPSKIVSNCNAVPGTHLLLTPRHIGQIYSESIKKGKKNVKLKIKFEVKVFIVQYGTV